MQHPRCSRRALPSACARQDQHQLPPVQCALVLTEIELHMHMEESLRGGWTPSAAVPCQALLPALYAREQLCVTQLLTYTAGGWTWKKEEAAATACLTSSAA